MARQQNDGQVLLNRLDSRLRMARASELASLGHYDLATYVLTPNLHLPSAACELDLLARVHVANGNYETAVSCWEHAIKAAPHAEADEYHECIKSLNQWIRYRQDLMIWKLRVLMCFAVIAITSWLILRLMRSGL